MISPWVHVGILSSPEVRLTFRGIFFHKERVVEGAHSFSFCNGQILWNAHSYPELVFEPGPEPPADFEIQDVPIGLNFHWQRQEHQRFRGALRICIENNNLVLINKVFIEEYLTSVISSEMKATAPLALLKAHAVISRSWLFAQIKRRNPSKNTRSLMKHSLESENRGEEIIQWYDHDEHALFDVCADDHCQRYQGTTRAYTPQVERAVRETCGEVLTFQGELCDARFSKCCGGALENYPTCWEDIDYPYLQGKRDNLGGPLPNLSHEEEAVRWILSEPDAYCRVKDPELLSQILNEYDQETSDFYRWKVTYTTQELSRLISRKLQIDFGTITDLIPLKRGVSGRIYRLQIVGTRHTLVIGKELFIRKALSDSHLYSTAFVVRKVGKESPTFTLFGAGWGHGVGLCQIGAAHMAAQGYTYHEIMEHYYDGAQIEKIEYHP